MVTNINVTVSREIVAATELLQQIWDTCEINAFIAGGAPRDWDHGMASRDFDIYFEGDISKLKHKMVPLAEAEDYSNPYSDEGIVSVKESVIEFKNVGITKTVQFVECDRNPHDVIRNFPFGMSQAYMNRYASAILTTDAYDAGKRNRMFTALRHHDRSYIYIAKILPRYQSYGFTPVGWSTR